MLWRRTQPRTVRIAALGVALLLLGVPVATAAPAAWAPAGDWWTALWAWLGPVWPGGATGRAGWGWGKAGIIVAPDGSPRNAGEPTGRDRWGIRPAGVQQPGSPGPGRCRPRRRLEGTESPVCVKIPDNCSATLDDSGELAVECGALGEIDRRFRLPEVDERFVPRVVEPSELQQRTFRNWPNPYTGRNWPYSLWRN